MKSVNDDHDPPPAPAIQLTIRSWFETPTASLLHQHKKALTELSLLKNHRFRILVALSISVILSHFTRHKIFFPNIKYFSVMMDEPGRQRPGLLATSLCPMIWQFPSGSLCPRYHVHPLDRVLQFWHIYLVVSNWNWRFSTFPKIHHQIRN